MIADTGANIHVICPRHRHYMTDLIENPGVIVETANGVVSLEINGEGVSKKHSHELWHSLNFN